MTRAYVRGADVYPGPEAAPDWRWAKIDGTWTELNRPEPLFCSVYFPPRPRHDPVDYPAVLHREVAKANRMSELAVYTPIALGHADPSHLFETLELAHHGQVSLGIYRVSEGYTKTAVYGSEGGFVCDSHRLNQLPAGNSTEGENGGRA